MPILTASEAGKRLDALLEERQGRLLVDATHHKSERIDLMRPKTFFILALLVFPMLFSGCAGLSVANEPDSHSFDFVVIADPQVGMYKAFKEAEDYSPELRDFARANDLVRSLAPDFVVIVGDLVETWNNEEQIAHFFDFVRSMEEHTPVYLVSGNHDMAPTAEGLAFYRERYGPDSYAWDHRGNRMIVLNSNLIFYSETFAEESRAQWEWLEKELADASRSGATNVFVFLHHPFFIEKAEEPDQYFNIPIETRQRYLDLLANHQISAVFSGHYHREAGGDHAGFEMIITSSLGKPLGKTPPGLRKVTVTGDSLTHEYLPLPPDEATPPAIDTPQ